MRKPIALGLMLGVVMLAIAGAWATSPASADNPPHEQDYPSTTDACAGCHRAHTGQASYLLKEDEEAICLSCHGDGTGSDLNVLQGWSSNPGALRGGGFLNAYLDTDDDSWRVSFECDEGTSGVIGSGATTIPGFPLTVCSDGDSTWSETGIRATFTGTGTALVDPLTNSSAYWTTATYQTPAAWPLHINILGTAQEVRSRHTVGATGQTVWGSGPVNATAFSGAALGTTKLECSSCHNQHGAGTYRILRPLPSLTATGFDLAFSNGVTVPDDCPTRQTGISGSTVATSCNAGNIHTYTTDNYMNATYVPWTTGSGGLAPVACTSGLSGAARYNIAGYPGVAASSSNCFSSLYYPTSLPQIKCDDGDLTYEEEILVSAIAGAPAGSVSGYPASYKCTEGTDATAPADGGNATYFSPNIDGMKWPDTVTASVTSALGISAWCAQCHQRYLGSSVWNKDSDDGAFTFRHTSQGTLAYNGRQCLTCHVAHGSNARANGEYSGAFTAPDGSVYPSDTQDMLPLDVDEGTITSEGSRLLKMDNRGICLKCHKRP